MAHVHTSGRSSSLATHGNRRQRWQRSHCAQTSLLPINSTVYCTHWAGYVPGLRKWPAAKLITLIVSPSGKVGAQLGEAVAATAAADGT